MFLFVVANATLFIRPAEVVPSLEALPIYELSIVGCLLVCLPQVLGQLTTATLRRTPITVCVLLMLAAVLMSHLSHMDLWHARRSAPDFLKVVLYFLLQMVVLDSPARLRQFLGWVGVFVLVLTGLAVLQYHGVLNIPALSSLADRYEDPRTGEVRILRRLQSTGIYNDPNDLCLVLVMGMGVGLYCFSARVGESLRGVWLLAVGLFGYALALTSSRGGLLALMAGLLVLLAGRYGWKRTGLLGALYLPVLLVAFGGRQTNITLSEGTSQARLQHWSEGLALLTTAPLFGIGQGRYAEHVGLEAHNSFVHCFTELGFFGGTVFLGAFHTAIVGMYRLRRHSSGIADERLRRVRPFLVAIVAAYAVGMCSLSRAYIVPTYMILGLAGAYLRLVGQRESLPVPCWDTRFVCRIALIGVAFIGSLYVFLRLTLQWG